MSAAHTSTTDTLARVCVSTGKSTDRGGKGGVNIRVVICALSSHVTAPS